MKTLLIAAAILSPIFMLLAMSCGTVIIMNAALFGAHISVNVTLAFLMILCMSSLIIMSACMAMMKYIPKINKLEEAEAETYKERRKLNRAIATYNTLIQNYEDTVHS